MPKFATPNGWLAYTHAGSGPVVLLVHGLGGTRATWRHLADALAESHTVIAVDLPGHGESDPPCAGYSPSAHANSLRDLLTGLDIAQATVIGHSLGGGVAMQSAYQYPELTAGLVLVSSGGLGPEVSPLLRAASLPGARAALRSFAQLPSAFTRIGISLASFTPLVSRDDVDPVVETMPAAFGTAQGRHTFVQEARSVFGRAGQVLSGLGQLEVLAKRPLLLVWGDDDRTIPPRHFRELSAQLPGANYVEIAGAGHFPHETKPDAVIAVLLDFLSAQRAPVEVATGDSAAIETEAVA